jgi:hypothetical protein
MADPVIFRIIDGQLGLAVVDRAAVGYSDDWRAPGGAEVDTVTLAAYVGSESFACQVTQARITATANATSETIEATMCSPERTVPQQGESSFAAEIGAFQDLTVVEGLSKFAFEHDAAECYLYLGFDGANPPKAIGRVIMASLPIGGTMRAKLLDTATWPFTFKPQIEFGNATASEAVPPVSVAFGATSSTEDEDEGDVREAS